MKKKKIALITLLFTTIGFVGAQTDPDITSWMINTTSLTGYNNLPANVQNVQYTSDTVWVGCSDIPAYSISPWPGDPNTASNQNFMYAIPRHPLPDTVGMPFTTPLGHEGVWINGVSIFNAKDANSYNNMNIWHSNAVVVEASSFDNCLGHPQQSGEYHNHQNPKCLYNANDSTHHSPLLGYAFDGYPIYGPYAYANTNGTGGIKRMRSSYHLRNISVRETKPNGDTLTSSQYGPAVSATYPLGYYVEDYKYFPGSGDLDSHNGRFCVTPEYPNGTYAYFVTIDSVGESAYPYVIGPTYYGFPATSNIGPGSTHNTPPDSAVTYTPTGIAVFNKLQNIQISPNPTSSEITISFPKSTSYPFNINVYNDMGQVVIKIKNSQTTRQTINMSDLPNGVYFIRLENFDAVTVKRIVLNK